MNRAQQPKPPDGKVQEQQTAQVSTATAASQMAASVDSIKLMAESIGIANLNDEAVKEIISDLTFTLKSILLVMAKQANAKAHTETSNI